MSKVLVEVLQGTAPASSGCNCCGCPSAASCGPAMDYKKETEELAIKLNEKFGDKVEVKFVDIDEVGLDKYPTMDRVLQMGYPYPITLINGDPRFAGGIMDTEIENAVQAVLDENN